MRSSCGKALEGREDQLEEFLISLCRHGSHLYTWENLFVVVGISKSWAGLYQSHHWAAMLRVEDWVEERRKVEGQGHGHSKAVEG